MPPALTRCRAGCAGRELGATADPQPVNGRQPGLCTAIDALPRETTPIAAQIRQRDRGREIRQIKVLPAATGPPLSRPRQA